jgi:hypothetical protein
LKVKGQENIFHTSRNQKRMEVTMLSGKIDFMARIK